MAVSVSIEKIGPAEAAQLLALNQKNRTKKPRKIVQFANDISAGRWKLTGDSIKVGRNGGGDILIDGQNRLEAVLRANCPIQTVVVRGLSYDEIMPRIDTGTARTFSDVLKLKGEKNTAVLAAIIGAVYRQHHRLMSASSLLRAVSHGELHSFYLDNPGIKDAAEVAIKFKAPHDLRLPMTAIGPAVFFAEQQDERATEDLVAQLITGENLVHGQPAFMLRKWVFNARNSPRNPSPLVWAACVNRAFIAHLEGSGLGMLKHRVGWEFPYVQDAAMVEAA